LALLTFNAPICQTPFTSNKSILLLVLLLVSSQKKNISFLHYLTPFTIQVRYLQQPSQAEIYDTNWFLNPVSFHSLLSRTNLQIVLFPTLILLPHHDHPLPNLLLSSLRARVRTPTTREAGSWDLPQQEQYTLFPWVPTLVLRSHTAAAKERGEEEQVLSGLASGPDPRGTASVTKRKQWVTVTADSQGDEGFCTAARLAVLKGLLLAHGPSLECCRGTLTAHVAIAILSFVVHLHGHHDSPKGDLQLTKANYRSPGTTVNDTRAPLDPGERL